MIVTIKTIKTIRTTKRPSTEIPFYQWSSSFIIDTEENYVNSGKLLAYKIELSADGLTEIRTSIWASMVDYYNFVSSSMGLTEWRSRESYQRTAGITSSFDEIPLEVNSVDEITSVSTVNLRN